MEQLALAARQRTLAFSIEDSARLTERLQKHLDIAHLLHRCRRHEAGPGIPRGMVVRDPVGASLRECRRPVLATIPRGSSLGSLGGSTPPPPPRAVPE